MLRVVVAALLLVAIHGWEDPFTLKDREIVIENQYLVVFQDSTPVETREDHMKYVSVLAEVHGIELIREFEVHTFSGYAISAPADFDFKMLLNREEIKYVEPNQWSYIQEVVEGEHQLFAPAAACVRQQDVPSWGLTRTTEHIKVLNGNYIFPDNSGTDIIGYVIDTGIYVEHPKFAGRAVWGVDTADKPPVFQDLNGHGTHVAGTMISETYGLARAGTAVAVKVLGGDGRGSNDGVIAGIQWAFKDHKTRGVGRSVANMSLGGGLSQAINDAVAAAVKGGMIFVVAAGNDGRGIIPSPDACKHSPASEPLAVTVGATDSSDYRADYSNYGKCVKIFAPGSAITSLWKKTTGQKEPINTISGTSMASPHVAGVAMKIWALNPTKTSSEITTLLYATTTNGVLKDVTNKGSPDKLVFQSCSA